MIFFCVKIYLIQCVEISIWLSLKSVDVSWIFIWCNMWEYNYYWKVLMFPWIFLWCNMWECRRHICGIRGFEAKWRWLWTLSLQFAFMSPNQPPFSRSKNLPFRNLLTLTHFRKSSRQGSGNIVRIVLMWYYARSILDFWDKRKWLVVICLFCL